MDRPAPHPSLRRIAGTELRVLSDVGASVIPVIQEEEEVIRGYVGRTAWPHRWVTLFILQDLQPLVRQVPEGAGLPPGGAAALDHQPVINVYDLADLATCHIFVNQKAMIKEGYWDDRLAVRGLLAHEHAHPLAENAAARASRRLKVELSWRMREPLALGIASRMGGSDATPDEPLTPTPRTSDAEPLGGQWRAKIDRLLALLVDKLCVYAPREIFANEVAIRSGFEEALLHLNRQNVAAAIRSVEGREALRRHLEETAADPTGLPRSGAELLLLIGDLKGYLDLALEVAPFLRTGRTAGARELEASLQASVFSALEPEVVGAYEALRDQYIALPSDIPPTGLVSWGEVVVQILAGVLKERGLALHYRVTVAH